MSPVDASTTLPASAHEEPDPLWKRTLYASWIAQLLSISAFSLCMPFIPFFIRDLGVTKESEVQLWAGITVTASGLALTLFSPIWGHLSDRFGRKIMVARAMFGGCVVLLVMGFVHDVYQLTAMRALQGCLTGTMVASTTLVSSVVPRHRIGWSLGLMYTAVLTGNSVGPWIGGVVADHFGYRVPFYLASCLLFMGGLAVVLFVRERFDPAEASHKNRRGLRKAFGKKGLAALLSVFFFLSFSGSFVVPIFPLFVEHIAVGYKPASITGLLLGLTGIAAGIGSVMVGRFGDRYGHRKVLVGTTLSTGLLVAPQALVQHLPELFALRIAGGLASGGTSPAMNSIIGMTAPPEIYGRAYGVAQSASSLGFALGPLVGASLSAQLGLRVPFAVMGGLLALSSLLVYLFVKPRDVEPVNGSDAAD